MYGSGFWFTLGMKCRLVPYDTGRHIPCPQRYWGVPQHPPCRDTCEGIVRDSVIPAQVSRGTRGTFRLWGFFFFIIIIIIIIMPPHPLSLPLSHSLKVVLIFFFEDLFIWWDFVSLIFSFLVDFFFFFFDRSLCSSFDFFFFYDFLFGHRPLYPHVLFFLFEYF